MRGKPGRADYRREALIIWKSTLIACLLMLIFVHNSQATHIRAGEIIAKRIDFLSLTYEFTFVGYRDTDSGIQFGSGTFDFGDGNMVTGDFIITEEEITPNVVRAEFTVIHTYAASATYTVSYREEFRNRGIANMANSVNTAFYVQTEIVIDPILGVNSTPVLTVPPIDDGLVGVSFIHNGGAFDPDDDSLAYRLVKPQQARDVNVTDYKFPNDPFFYSNPAQGDEAQENFPTFDIDPITGNLSWDAPGDFLNLSGQDCPSGANNCAEYNVAFVVEEWRNVFGRPTLLGRVTRDMQIIITDGDNEKPQLEVPDPICVEAGTIVSETVVGTDPDGHDVKLEAFGGPFEVVSSATVTPDPPRFEPPPASLQFNWETVCGHVRVNPYQVQFKVSDNPIEQGQRVGPTLVDFETWEITVVGPQPEGLTASAGNGRAINLDWSGYSCNNAFQMQVWRRVGEFMFEPDECMVGIPPNSGYQLVKTIGIDTTQYLDDDRGRGLAAGANYCYRLVAIFPAPGGGISYASDEVCLTLQADSPVITNVDIRETGTEGEVLVRWTPPYETNPTQFPPPYTYNLYRSNDLIFQEPGTEIATGISDTVFVDTGINTLQRGFSYRVELFDNGGFFVDSSAEASSVRMEIDPQVSGIGLHWRAVVPWSNNIQRYPYHYIYRDNVTSDETELVLIDSVQVAQEGFFYFDDGAFNDEPLDENTEYCYYVTAVGAYDNSPLIPEPLINRSEILCAQPRDVVPPCTPLQLSLADFDCEEDLAQQTCEFDNYENNIAWEVDPSSNCDEDIESFNIYFSATGEEEDFELIANTVDNFYTHEGLSGYKGCYKVSAVDRSGNESELTEAVCADNCPSYQLPNVFTPNNDGVNDLFTPLYSNPADPINDFDNANCPRFVRGVELTVFDRSGKNVFSYNSQDSESGILINWNGKTEDGRDLPAGTYYYLANVEFDVLSSSDSKQELSGWVQLLR